MTTFLNSLSRGTNLSSTENGAVTNVSSLDPVVDFFGMAGAMRSTPKNAVKLFDAAYVSDPLTTLRTLFYLRDIRGGQGERDVFRACFARLGDIDPGAALKVFRHIPFYGRWDDVLHVDAFRDGAQLIAEQLTADLSLLSEPGPVSLLAKWMPSENASSPATKALAKHLRNALGMSSLQYRKALSSLRARIRLLEQDMSANNWTGIDHSTLPSQAHRRHVKAFKRHTPDVYQAYLESVNRGEKKINVKDVYPYEIYDMVTQGQTDYADAAWNNLPDYTRGTNALVMADVSGSMFQAYASANPIAVSVSLALYFAQRNTGPFHGYFMTFSQDPRLVKVQGDTLTKQIMSVQSADRDWATNTNLLAAFRAILNAGKSCPSEMPSVLYTISDMEFDRATSQRYVPGTATPAETVFNVAKAEFAAHGLELPHVVFWNVQARQKQAPATVLDGRVSLVSGLSPTIFAQAVEGKSPRELVDAVVNAERYQRIVL